MAPDTRSGQTISEVIISFLKSEEFSKIIYGIVEKETKKLQEDILSLKNEVVILRESNIQLLHLTSNMPSYSKVVQNGNGKSNKMLKVTESHDQSALQMCINNDKKQTENKNTEVRNMQYTEKKNDTRPVEGNKMDKQLPAKDENIWEIQDRRRQKNYKSIVYGKLTNGTTFKGVTKYIDYHVFNCDRDMKIEDLKKYLTDEVKIPDIICEKMDSKHPEKYSSFKISVPVNFVETFKNPDIWPEYICINRFNNRFLRKKALETNEGRK